MAVASLDRSLHLVDVEHWLVFRPLPETLRAELEVGELGISTARRIGWSTPSRSRARPMIPVGKDCRPAGSAFWRLGEAEPRTLDNGSRRLSSGVPEYLTAMNGRTVTSSTPSRVPPSAMATSLLEDWPSGFGRWPLAPGCVNWSSAHRSISAIWARRVARLRAPPRQRHRQPRPRTVARPRRARLRAGDAQD